jgi:hypothetical protein
MWKHNCKVDGLMQVESGKECNWCGMTIEDELNLRHPNDVLIKDSVEDRCSAQVDFEDEYWK